jgi:eukaryotic-like serine/threonine-protein kinase
MNESALSTPPESFGRYLLYPAIARGGMATVHTARLLGAEGFTRLVAAKRLHPHFTDDPDFVRMFHDEACIASRIHHPNVVPVLDVVLSGHELILVQEYVHGVPLSHLLKRAQIDETPVPVDVVIAVLTGILAGLHAAHEVRDDLDHPLEIIHRDVSPQNVMVSVDGIPRLLDFGIAKARTSTHHTREGVFKGKLAYMAPEQLRLEEIDRTIDIYATGVLAWEMLLNRRVYDGRHEVAFVQAVMSGELPSLVDAVGANRNAIDDLRWSQLVALEPIVARAMAQRPEDRFATAAEMMFALLEVRASATSLAVADWVRSMGADYLDQRQRTLAANEESWRRTSVYSPTPTFGPPRAASGTLIIDTPSGVGLVPVGSRSSMPPSVSFPSAGPHAESGAYRVALGQSALARASAKFGARGLSLLTAGAFAVAAILGGLVRGAAESTPTPAGVRAEAVATSAPKASPIVAPATPAPLPAPTPTAQDVPVATPPVTSSPVLVRPTHVAPPPPPPRMVWVPRAPPPPPTQTSTSAPTTPSAKSDCNPPFYFDGPKKVFKPSCL